MDCLGLIQPDNGTTLHRITHWTEIELREWNRKMLRQVLKKKIPLNLVKSMIKLYDFERCQPFSTDESALQLEQMFGIDKIPWPETVGKLSTIHLKATKELKSVLKSYGLVYPPQLKFIHHCHINDPSQFRELYICKQKQKRQINYQPATRSPPSETPSLASDPFFGGDNSYSGASYT